MNTKLQFTSEYVVQHIGVTILRQSAWIAFESVLFSIAEPIAA